jgi:hypothetical protein
MCIAFTVIDYIGPCGRSSSQTAVVSPITLVESPLCLSLSLDTQQMEEDFSSCWDVDIEFHGLESVLEGFGGESDALSDEESFPNHIITSPPWQDCQLWASISCPMEGCHWDGAGGGGGGAVTHGGAKKTKKKSASASSASSKRRRIDSTALSFPLNRDDAYVEAKMSCIFTVEFEKTADLPIAELLFGAGNLTITHYILSAYFSSDVYVSLVLMEATSAVSKKSGKVLTPCASHPKLSECHPDHTEILSSPTLVWDEQSGQLSLQAALKCKGPCDRRRSLSCHATVQVVCAVQPGADMITLTTHLLHLTCNRSTGRSDRRRMALSSK